MLESRLKTKCITENQKQAHYWEFPLILKIKRENYFQYNDQVPIQLCLLVWMFYSRKSNNLLNKALERALRLTCKDNENNFQALLNENNETSVYQRNLRFLMTEIIKLKTTMFPHNASVIPVLWKHFSI